MQAVAKLKYANFSAQKARLVVDQIRGLAIDKAIDLLAFSPKKSAISIKKLLESAIANAEENSGADIEELKVSTIYVDNGPTHKRVRPRAKGRSDHIFKRTCHITVIVSDEQKERAS